MAVGSFRIDELEYWDRARMLVADRDRRGVGVAYGSNFVSGDGYGLHLGNSRLLLLNDSPGVRDLCRVVVMLDIIRP